MTILKMATLDSSGAKKVPPENTNPRLLQEIIEALQCQLTEEQEEKEALSLERAKLKVCWEMTLEELANTRNELTEKIVDLESELQKQLKRRKLLRKLLLDYEKSMEDVKGVIESIVERPKETTSNLIQPEYSVTVLNTENVILSLGDVDDDTNYDLEVLKDTTDNTRLEKKLYEFHKYLNLADKTERPKEKQFKPLSQLKDFVPMPQMSYPDSPYEIAADEKHLGMLERRQKKKKRKKHRQKSVKLGNFRGALHGKRDATAFVDVEDVEAEYNSLEKQYMDYLENSKKNNIAFKYSDEGKPEESVKDVLTKLFDFKTPKNCTNMTGIGVQALECIIKNFQTGVFDRSQMINGILVITFIWICIYLAIALPLWCSKGWCCCCCRCKFCFPEKTVREIQTYIIENPPGTYKNRNGKDERYNPTQKETELYERIKRSIAEF